MEILFDEIVALLERIKGEGLLIPSVFDPPTSGIDLGELPDELKYLRTMYKYLSAEIKNEQKSSPSQSRTDKLGELELKKEITRQVYEYRLKQLYSNSWPVQVYSDWHVYSCSAFPSP